MNSRRFVLLIAIMAIVLIVAPFAPALAQCAMCKESLANSANAATLTRGLNMAVLVLLVPPVAIFAGIFGVFYRYRNIQGHKTATDEDDNPQGQNLL